MKQSLFTFLEKIGLTKGEAQVYLALLELGRSSTGRITKKAEVSSSKVYEVLQRLITKGLVNYSIENGVRYYNATPAERLVDFLEEKKEVITKSQEEIKAFIPQLEFRRKQSAIAEVMVYRGPPGPKIVLKEILEAGKRGEDNCGFGTNEDDYVKYFPAQLSVFIQELKKLNIKSRLIFAHGFKSPNFTAKIKYLPPEYFSPVRTMIYGNKVVIVDFTKPFTTIIIEKKEVAKAYKHHFNLLWKIAKTASKQ